MIGILLAVGALLGGGTYVTYRMSPLSRSSRRARGAVREVGAEKVATVRALDEPTEQLEKHAARYATDRRRETLAGTPVDALKDVGAKQVRWNTLREAGYRSLEDLRGASARGLMAVKGIGPVSAQKIKSAARRMDTLLQRQPVAAPGPELEESHAPELVKSSLDLLDARQELAPLADRLRTEHGELRERAEDVQHESSLGRWIFGSSARDDREAVQAKARDLEADARRVLDELGAEAKEARRRLAQRMREPLPERGVLAEAYKQQHAAIHSVLEGVLTAKDSPMVPIDPEVGARLPEQIVDRVQALDLKVEAMGVVLRRYQDFGARFVIVQERTVLGDDMGLGKTMQALAAMVHLASSGEGGRFLVVAPATVVPSWAREVEAHTPLPCFVLRGKEREAALDEWIDKGGVAVTSYSTLRRMEVDEALPGSVDLLVADEAHFLKNPEASRTQAVMELLPMSRRVCLMTGTPIENRLEEFRMLVQMLRPELLDEPGWDPSEGFVDPLAFQQEVAGVYLRRNQGDVLHELPPRLEKEEWVELDAVESAAYRESVESGNIMGMRRAATIGDWHAEHPRVPASSKLDRLVDLVEEHAAAGRKVLVFSYFRHVLAALERRLSVLGSIHGDVASDEREELMQRFRDHDGHGILIGQITAAGVGLNLQAASVVVLMEPQWKPSTEEQAIARAHRMGQTERVVVHRLLARDSVDERIMELLAGKQELFERYARESALKAASSEATETALARMVVEVEQARLADDGAPQAGAAPAPAPRNEGQDEPHPRGERAQPATPEEGGAGSGEVEGELNA